MTPQELVDRLGALDAAATPGPWTRQEVANGLCLDGLDESYSDGPDHFAVRANGEIVAECDYSLGGSKDATLIAEGRTLGVVAGRIVADMLNRHIRTADGDCLACSDSLRGSYVPYPCPDVEAAERIIREAGL